MLHVYINITSIHSFCTSTGPWPEVWLRYQQKKLFGVPNLKIGCSRHVDPKANTPKNNCGADTQNKQLLGGPQAGGKAKPILIFATNQKKRCEIPGQTDLWDRTAEFSSVCFLRNHLPARRCLRRLSMLPCSEHI